MNSFLPRRGTRNAKALVKALPTVRDHTSDQLNEEGDEYIPKEFDEEDMNHDNSTPSHTQLQA
jgi:hypothetical protein